MERLAGEEFWAATEVAIARMIMTAEKWSFMRFLLVLR
jgi:hypothetical protein